MCAAAIPDTIAMLEAPDALSLQFALLCECCKLLASESALSPPLFQPVSWKAAAQEMMKGSRICFRWPAWLSLLSSVWQSHRQGMEYNVQR